MSESLHGWWMGCKFSFFFHIARNQMLVATGNWALLENNLGYDVMPVIMVAGSRFIT